MRPDLWLELLDDHGPLFAEEVDDLVDEGEWDVDEPLPDDVLDVDELFVRKSWLLGKLITHRLTQTEVQAGMVEVLPDWAVALGLLDDEVALADGGVLEVVGPWREKPREVPDELADAEILFVFDPDFFTRQAMAAGVVVGLSLDADGAVRVQAVGNVAPEVDLDIDRGDSEEADYLMWRLASEGLLDVPRPPLCEMAVAQGLQVRGGRIYSQDYPFALRRFEAQLSQLAQVYDCDGDEVVACAVLGTLAEYPDASLDDLGVTDEQYQASLAMSYAARIMASEMFREGSDPARFLAAATRLGPVSEAAGLSLRFCAAVLAEYSGDVRTAVEQMRGIFVDRPDWPSAILALASYAQSAGDPQRAADLLEMLEGTQTRVDRLRSYLGTAQVRRNDRCPCGSGRKYKQCHQGKPMLTAGRRAEWVLGAALEYMFEYHAPDMATLTRVVDFEADAGDGKGFSLVCDLQLMERGCLETYRRTRGPLLPEADRDLIDSWLAGPPRTLFEVLDNSVGAMRVRDVATGDQLVVSEKSAAAHMRPGSFWVSRISPVGDELQLFGGVYPVALNQREAVLEVVSSPDLFDVARLAGLLVRNLAAPTLVTGSGEDLVVSTAVVKVHGDLSALNGPFEGVDGRWFLMAGDTIHATLTRAGKNLKVEALSKERLDVALRMIQEALPGSEVLDVNHQRPSVAGSALKGAIEPQEVSDEQRQVMTDYIAKYERDWLDMDIPALDGLTPRQAAADPTRRDDLVRLLATFPETDDPTQMSPARLRALLGM